MSLRGEMLWKTFERFAFKIAMSIREQQSK